MTGEEGKAAVFQVKRQSNPSTGEGSLAAFNLSLSFTTVFLKLRLGPQPPGGYMAVWAYIATLAIKSSSKVSLRRCPKQPSACQGGGHSAVFTGKKNTQGPQSLSKDTSRINSESYTEEDPVADGKNLVARVWQTYTHTPVQTLTTEQLRVSHSSCRA